MRPSSLKALNSSSDASRTRAYLSLDTIAANATAPGGAIAILRISGPDAFDAAKALAPNCNIHELEPRKLILAHLIDESHAALDEALIVRFIAPESYTGENVVEFHLHGSGFILERVLERLQAEGVRQALPGEFSFRAIRNGKMTLSQAQAVVDLVRSGNDSAVKLALEKLSGSQNKWVGAIADEVRQIALLCEVEIDFSDQDLSETSLPTLKRRVEALRPRLSDLVSSFDRGIRIQEGIRAAFVGLPNAGKSSFFNALLGEERSIVSDIPGTTRDVIKEQVTLRSNAGSVTLRLEDTAGLRATTDLIETLGVQKTFESIQEADLVIFLVDSSVPIEPAAKQWLALETPGNRAIGILTKSDLVSEAARKIAIARLRELGHAYWIETSASTGAGIQDAIEAIVTFSRRWTHRLKGELVLTRLDQYRSAQSALESLNRALDASEIDLFAADLRQTLSSLALLIGDTLPDDILGQIFSDFCIGK